jgi:hypothetical protein
VVFIVVYRYSNVIVRDTLVLFQFLPNHRTDEIMIVDIGKQLVVRSSGSVVVVV